MLSNTETLIKKTKSICAAASRQNKKTLFSKNFNQLHYGEYPLLRFQLCKKTLKEKPRRNTISVLANGGFPAADDWDFYFIPSFSQNEYRYILVADGLFEMNT